MIITCERDVIIRLAMEIIDSARQPRESRNHVRAHERSDCHAIKAAHVLPRRLRGGGARRGGAWCPAPETGTRVL